MFRRIAWVGSVVLVVLAGADLEADTLAPPPTWARTVETVDEHVPIFAEPRAGARRRGTLSLGTRLAFARRVAGTGCHTSVWLELASDVFACEEFFQYSRQPPSPRATRSDAALPYEYFAVVGDGAHAYAEPFHYFADDFAETLGQGFIVVADRERTVDGVRFLHLARGTWMAAESLRPMRGSGLEGVHLDAATSGLAWIRRRDVPIFDRPRGRVLRRAPRRERVIVAAIEDPFARLADGGYVRVADLNRVTPSTPPDGLADGDRWIDVSVSEQVLVAYEGPTPVFATLVSTGADAPDRRTPLGTFPVWAKLETSDMQNLDDEGIGALYLVERVPWVQYFEGSVGLHAAFWHDDFGHRRSHGCVNLSPRDARTLFTFTRPTLPAGFEALIPTAAERPTLVRVRE